MPCAAVPSAFSARDGSRGSNHVRDRRQNGTIQLFVAYHGQRFVCFFRQFRCPGVNAER